MDDIDDASHRAFAKINLALHVTGKRADGYHLLDSLVAFADYGDTVLICDQQEGDAPRIRIEVSGPMAEGVPTGPDNLVWRAVDLMAQPEDPPIRIDLWKGLPHAAGIGGGSADAAAALRAMRDLRGRALPSADAILSLGADVPVCLHGQSVRMRGIGEELTPAPQLPPVWAVLLNPGVAVPTKDVFARLANRNGSGLPDMPREWTSAEQLFAYLGRTRNDLQDPACQICRPIREALLLLRDLPGCGFSRMSGSGATCFGLFSDPDAARKASERLEGGRNWVRLVRLH